MTLSSDAFYAEFSNAGEDGLLVAHGNLRDRIVLKIMPGRLYVLIEGEPTGDDLVNCFRKALDARPQLSNTPTLVDMTRFIGAAEWGALFKVRDMTDWGPSDAPNRSYAAYVVRNDMFEPLIDIVASLFDNATHRSFKTHAEAQAWLDESVRDA